MRLLSWAKTAVLAFSLSLAGVSPGFAIETKPFDAASFKAAQSAGKPILVDIYASWCPTCKAQQQVLKSLEGKPEYASITVFQVDFDAQADVVRSLGARSQSTLIGFNGATETGRSAGDTKQASIEALLTSTLKK